ncbi:MAG TPA: ATP-dependent helicase, partial [Mycobacteriales bacterium]|nr:ATP-dependent helicase [Mycobacteriales bacterium]
SPLKALAVDVERNLRAPLAGITAACERLQLPAPDVRVGLRSGDTPADERRSFAKRPPDILITTPESLFLLLTSQAREALKGIETVIVDEVHAVASTKRGAHLALTLERLDHLLGRHARRIGLSATVRPIEEVARFLGGSHDVTVVQPPANKTVELEVVVPVEDMTALGDNVSLAAGGDDSEQRASIWPALEARVLDLIETHRSTIVFANARRTSERLTARLNEIANERAGADFFTNPFEKVPAEVMGQSGQGKPADAHAIEVARAHHGSISREQRSETEELLKTGRLPAVVATSSLELGIDMGAVDLVVQVASPPSVASGLQRVGRAGHQVGAVSKGVIFPKYRGELVPCAVVAQRMRDGQIESMAYPRNPLDVLAQQVVAMTSMDTWSVDELGAVVRRAAPFAGLPQSAFEAVLDMLSGRYPSDDFAELKPRVVWDRVEGTLTARPGAQRLAVTSGGTIPDRGMFGVFLATGEGPGRRVGELDEEMVYESRVGDTFLLGTTSWRIEDITQDRVLVTPAPGVPGRMPFWKGDAPGRPYELGQAVGAFLRETGRLDDAAVLDDLRSRGLDEWAAANLASYLREQREATGHLPDDRTIVVERFRDELGDWRLAVHSPFGAQVNAPWALAIGARLRETHGLDAQAMHSDDGIVLRLPDITGDDSAPRSDLALLDPEDVEQVVQAEVGGSALFASRFRECAARALLLPRRNPGKRTPLWQQRQRSAQLLGVASQFGSFPIVLETMRECLQDVFDVPALTSLMRDIASRAVRVVEVETEQPSPFARGLLFGYVQQFLYEGDAPLAERRAAALSLDSTLLAELLGQAELRELLDPEALAQVEAEVGRLAEDRRAKDLEGVADLLRTVGDLTTEEAIARGATPQWLHELEDARRAVRVRITGEERWIAVEDAARVRDALGVPLPVGLADAFLEPVRDPLGDVVARYARTHGPFLPRDVAARYGLGVAVVDGVLARLAAAGRVVQGEFRPDGVDLEWCDTGVLRLLRRRSLAALRQEVEPVPAAALGRFLPTWQCVGAASGRGEVALLRAIEQLQGSPIPASSLEGVVLPARVSNYSPAMLDELTSSGEVIWTGNGALPGADGWIVLALAEHADLLLPAPSLDIAPPGSLGDRVLAALDGDAALFFRALSDRASGAGTEAVSTVDDDEMARTVWDLVWSGLLTNDTLAPLRTRLGGRVGPRRAASPRARFGRAPRPGMPVRSGPPTMAGRWSRVPSRLSDPTRTATALAEQLLDRHGVLTRGAVQAEGVPGGFAAIYRVLSAFEESGRCRRGYFVEGLGAAQFATPGAVDRLRALAREPDPEPAFTSPVPGGWRPSPEQLRSRRDDARAVVLAATDPANPFGAALPWPAREGEGKHRPARKAGALVALVDGHLVLYVEKGGKTLLSFEDDPTRLQPAVDALALAVREGLLGKLAVEKADGTSVLASPLADALEAAGFRPTPRGLRLRA